MPGLSWSWISEALSMNRINDDELEKLRYNAAALAQQGGDQAALRSISISNLIVTELLTRILEK